MRDIDIKIIERVQELARKKGWKMSQIALACLNKRITSLIIGFSTMERIDEAIEASEKTLTDEDEHYHEELYEPKRVVGHD